MDLSARPLHITCYYTTSNSRIRLTISYRLTLFTWGGPCQFSRFKQRVISWPQNPLRTSCLFRHEKIKFLSLYYYLINIVNITHSEFEFLNSKLHSAPLSSINRTTMHRCCLQLSVYASIGEFNPCLNAQYVITPVSGLSIKTWHDMRCKLCGIQHCRWNLDDSGRNVVLFMFHLVTFTEILPHSLTAS